jgi:hypothetical protein
MDTYEYYFLISCCILFIIIGLFGNIISVFIFLSKEFLNLPTSFYLVSSTFLNLISLLYLPVIVFSEIWTTSTISCKILGGFSLVLVEIQSWVYVLCSVDRYITTAFPAKFKFKNKQSFQITTLLSCSMILLGLCAPVIYTYERFDVKFSQSNQTYGLCTNPPELAWVYVYLQYQFPLFRVIIPFIITIFASTGTIYTLCASKRRVGITEWVNMKKEVQFAKALIIMDFLFIFFRLPQFINTVINNSTETFLYSFSYSAFCVLGAVHNTFIFFIFIVFNRIYRDLFLRYIFCRK